MCFICKYLTGSVCKILSYKKKEKKKKTLKTQTLLHVDSKCVWLWVWQLLTKGKSGSETTSKPLLTPLRLIYVNRLRSYQFLPISCQAEESTCNHVRAAFLLWCSFSKPAAQHPISDSWPLWGSHHNTHPNPFHDSASFFLLLPACDTLVHTVQFTWVNFEVKRLWITPILRKALCLGE